MIPSRLHWRRASLAVLGLILVAGPGAAQAPSFGGFGSAGYGSINGVFGATGYGASGLYGNANPLSLGISGGGGSGSGAWNRYGRWSSQNAQDLDSIFPRPFPSENVAHLRILLPTRDAELWVNDTLMKKQGTKRSFISPFLTPDKDFIYELKVRYKDQDGRTVERQRTITVQAGSQDIVDFTRPAGSPPTPSRSPRESGASPDR